ncbi:MAG: hypothetical protein FWF79_09520 [Defluviitaleaceae bacterium]|nr:hypothetical protein [Defluviitaleaceae bacterium]
MESNTNIKRNEKIFNSLFDIAADEAFKEEMDALPSCEELNNMYPRTKSLDKKVYAVINKELNALKRKRALRTLAKVAAVLCIIVVASAGALISIEASRNFILNFIIDICP